MAKSIANSNTIEPFGCCSRWQECMQAGRCVQEGELRELLEPGCMLRARLGSRAPKVVQKGPGGQLAFDFGADLANG